MNKMQAQVLNFHKVAALPAPDVPLSEPFDPALRLKLIAEEAAEGFHALEALHNGDVGPYVDLLCDLLYFTFGAAVAAGINLEPFFDEVHRANMDKVGPDGVVIYREDGKVLKPENWEPANLAAVWHNLYRKAESNGEA
jgi:predicted HAD superfamily Cof-like phosphohydrolase